MCMCVCVCVRVCVCVCLCVCVCVCVLRPTERWTILLTHKKNLTSSEKICLKLLLNSKFQKRIIASAAYQ